MNLKRFMIFCFLYKERTMKKQFRNTKTGTALIIVMITFVATFGFTTASLMISNSALQNVNYNGAKMKSQYIANSGLEKAIGELKTRSVKAQGNWDLVDSITNLDSSFFNETFQSEGISLGQFNITITILDATDSLERTYLVESQGAVARGKNPEFAKTKVSATVRLHYDKSEGFQFSYFMNHFGWMASNSNWVFNGNMGSAGIFDWFNSPLSVNGTPQFKSFNDETGSLENPVFHTPKNDSSVNNLMEGGTISGFDIQSGGNITGQPYNEYPHQPMPKMPVINEEYFSRAREEAYSQENYIKVGDTFVSDGVYGDKQMPSNQDWQNTLLANGYQGQYEVSSGNLYLEGTDANPIEIKGSVVVEGNLIIKGKVKGQGAISAKGNIYIAGDIEYVNPLTDPSQATTQSSIENWISDNENKDALGLYAKGTIGAGGYDTYINSGSVESWLDHPSNESAEKKNGFDGMPNTNDEGEDGADSNIFNVERYTAEDSLLGRIPAGSLVGDVVPGTGEDFDGDGKNDSRIDQDDFRPRGGDDMEDKNTNYENVNLSLWGNAPISSEETLTETNRATPLNPENISSSEHNLGNLSTNSIRRLDVVLFTNKAFTSYLTGNGALIWNGALISRLEAAIVGGQWVFNFDRRLMGGGGNLGFEIPVVWQEIEISNYNTK